MTVKAKIKILKNFLGSCYKSSDEYLFHCPKCEHHKKKLSVNIEKDKFKCWICDYRGSAVMRLVRRHGTYIDYKNWLKFVEDGDVSSISFDDILRKLTGESQELNKTEESVTLPDGYKTLISNDSLSTLPARRFLDSRGITAHDVLKWKIGYCTKGSFRGRVVVPSFNLNGDVNYFIARTYDGHHRKYMNPSVSKDIVFNELYVDFTDDLVLVEGVFDAIIAGNAVPILGTTLRDDSRLFKRIVSNRTPVYIALDKDALEKEQAIIQRLLSYNVDVFKIDLGDKPDVGEMTKEEFAQAKDKAVFVDDSTSLYSRISSIN
jgi:DNA primase